MVWVAKVTDKARQNECMTTVPRVVASSVAAVRVVVISVVKQGGLLPGEVRQDAEREGGLRGVVQRGAVAWRCAMRAAGWSGLAACRRSASPSRWRVLPLLRVRTSIRRCDFARVGFSFRFLQRIQFEQTQPPRLAFGQAIEPYGA